METAVLLRQDAPLIGILSEPADADAAGDAPAVIILNAGIVHRVGPNRLHVKIARTLASAGFRVIRFDFSGLGDSAPRGDDVPFARSSVEEIQWTMDYLSDTAATERFVLLGLCSGANAAFRAACSDPRAAAIVGINGTYLEDDEMNDLRGQIQRSIHGRYYWKHVLDPAKWRRFLTGKSDLRKIVKFIGGRCIGPDRKPDRLPPPASSAGRWETLARRGVDSLLIYSEGSTALDAYSLAVKSCLKTEKPGSVTVETIGDSDHVFTLLWSQKVLLDLIRTWMLSEDRCWKRNPAQRQTADPA